MQALVLKVTSWTEMSEEIEVGSVSTEDSFIEQNQDLEMNRVIVKGKGRNVKVVNIDDLDLQLPKGKYLNCYRRLGRMNFWI